MKPALGVLLAAVATFMFGFVFWAVLDVPGKAMKSFDDDAAVQSALTDLFDESTIARMIGRRLVDQVPDNWLSCSGLSIFLQFASRGTAVGRFDRWSF